MESATSQMMKQDVDVMAAKRTADYIIHLLTDFIPDKCRREAWDCIANAAYKNGMEITSKAMRQQYESWMKTQLDMLNSTTIHPKEPT